MSKYVAFLRGINVGGKNRVKMNLVTTAFEEAGFLNVSTYLQSGNVLFESRKTNRQSIQNSIASLLQEKSGIEINVIVRSILFLEQALADNPYQGKYFSDKSKCFITFLSRPPGTSELRNLDNISFAGESFALKEDLIYLYLTNGYGRAKLTNNYFEKRLRVSATTRNIKTIRQLTLKKTEKL